MQKRALFVVVLAVACTKHAPVESKQAADSAVPTTSAASSTPAAPSNAIAPKTRTTLADFLPEAIGGIPMDRATDDGPTSSLPVLNVALGAYIDAATPKSILVTLVPGGDLEFARGRFHKLKAGQSKEIPEAHVSLRAFDVNGTLVVRTRQLATMKSEAFALLKNDVSVNIVVDPASDPDEPVRYMRDVDLVALAALAKKK